MPVLIKRYANRKLYNTETSRYITLKGISEIVQAGEEICVIDNESGEEITPIVLSQILVDDQKQSRDGGSSEVPHRVLGELIQRSGDALYNVLRRSADEFQENLGEARENLKRLIQPEGQVENKAETSQIVYAAVERALKVVDLPTRSDLEALNKNLERLAAALESFEDRLASIKDR